MVLLVITLYLALSLPLVVVAAHEELAGHLALLVALGVAQAELLELILVALEILQAHRRHKVIMEALEQIAPLNMAEVAVGALLLSAQMVLAPLAVMVALALRLLFLASLLLMQAEAEAGYTQLEPLEQVALVVVEMVVINPLLQLLEPLILAVVVAQAVVQLLKIGPAQQAAPASLFFATQSLFRP
jgi:hypothetical protein